MMCLEGLVVLDLTRRYPGAFAGMFLADHGAEVIKVDPPGPSTAVPPGFDEERYAAHNAVDRNKRSVVLNLKNEAARGVFYRLCERADVLIEGMRPGVADRLGIGYSRLSEINPRLIYCSLSGFGQDGPYVDIPAHDMNYIALGGALSLIGEKNGRPYLPSNLIADFAGAGLHGTIGILLAVIARAKTGRGQHVDVGYLDTVLSLLTDATSNFSLTGVVPKRGQSHCNGGKPWAQVFKCKDGEYFAIGAAEQNFWQNFCVALGRPDLIPLRMYAEKTDEIVAQLAAIFATRTRDEWAEFLREKEACATPVKWLDEALADPQIIHRKMALEVEHPVGGTIRQTGIPVKLSDTPGSIRHLGVPLGKNTPEVLVELGYSAAEASELRRAGGLD